MAERGVIEDRARAKQLITFKNLRYGSKTPTDLDGFTDFGNKVFVFKEYKYKNKTWTPGQKLALERLCDATERAGIISYLLAASHEVDNPNDDIDGATALVVRYRRKEKWYTPRDMLTVRQMMDKICKKHNLETVEMKTSKPEESIDDFSDVPFKPTIPPTPPTTEQVDAYAEWWNENHGKGTNA